MADENKNNNQKEEVRDQQPDTSQESNNDAVVDGNQINSQNKAAQPAAESEQKNTTQQGPNVIFSTKEAKTQSTSDGNNKGWLKRPLFYVILAVVLVLLSGGAYAFYEQQIAPKTAVRDFVNAHRSIDSFSYEIEAETATKENSDVYGDAKVDGDATLSGSVDTSGESDRFSLDINSEIGTAGMKLDIIAETVFVDDMMHFKISQPQLVEVFMPGIIGSWYKTDVSEQIEQQDTCSAEELANAYATFETELEKDSPFVNTERVGWGFETIEGSRTSHYRGEVNLEKLVTGVNATEEKIAESCEDYEASETDIEDFEDYEVTYDVWLGSDLSRMTIDIENDDLSSTATVTTNNYDQGVDIEIPENAKDFEEVMQQQQQEQLQLQSQPQQLDDQTPPPPPPPEFEFNDYEMDDSDSGATNVLGLNTSSERELVRSILLFFLQ